MKREPPGPLEWVEQESESLRRCKPDQVQRVVARLAQISADMAPLRTGALSTLQTAASTPQILGAWQKGVWSDRFVLRIASPGFSCRLHGEAKTPVQLRNLGSQHGSFIPRLGSFMEHAFQRGHPVVQVVHLGG